MHGCMHVCMHPCMHACMCMHVCIHTCMHPCMLGNQPQPKSKQATKAPDPYCMHACMHTCMHMPAPGMHAHAYMLARIHVCIHAYVHAYARIRQNQTTCPHPEKFICSCQSHCAQTAALNNQEAQQTECALTQQLATLRLGS